MPSFIVHLLRDHAHAPRFDEPVGEAPGLTPSASERMKTFQGALESAAKDSGLAGVIQREAIESTVGRARTLTAQYRRSLANAPTHIGIEDLPHLPTVSRADLAARPEAFVPDDADLDALLITRAHVAGVTAAGSAAACIPTDSFALPAEAALLLVALRRRGISVELAPDLLALVRVDAARDLVPSREAAREASDPAWPEAVSGPSWPDAGTPLGGPAWPVSGSGDGPQTRSADPAGDGAGSAAAERAGDRDHAVVGGDGSRGGRATALAALGGAGYLRFDLSKETWRNRLDPVRLLAAFAPGIVTGTISSLEDLTIRIEEAMRSGGPALKLRVKAVVVPAGALARSLRDRMESAFSAPVIDWYAIPEVGPIAYGCSAGRGLHVLPPDLVVETDSTNGELAVTGGRNAFLPLVRYRPGDRGRIERGPCSCGDRTPRIVGLERA